jgi:hypothetical protein
MKSDELSSVLRFDVKRKGQGFYNAANGKIVLYPTFNYKRKHTYNFLR